MNGTCYYTFYRNDNFVKWFFVVQQRTKKFLYCRVNGMRQKQFSFKICHSKNVSHFPMLSETISINHRWEEKTKTWTIKKTKRLFISGRIYDCQIHVDEFEMNCYVGDCTAFIVGVHLNRSSKFEHRSGSELGELCFSDFNSSKNSEEDEESPNETRPFWEIWIFVISTYLLGWV